MSRSLHPIPGAPVISDSAPKNRNDSSEHCRDILPCLLLLVGKRLVGWLDGWIWATQQTNLGERSHSMTTKKNDVNRCLIPKKGCLASPFVDVGMRGCLASPFVDVGMMSNGML